MLPAGTLTPVRAVHLAIAAGITCFVTWGLLAPDPLAGVENTSFGFVRALNDLVMHFSVYAVFSLISLSVMRRRTDGWIRAVILALLCTHAVTTEVLQSFVPERVCDPLDAVGNFMGIGFGSYICEKVQRRLKQTPVTTS